jgi:hypothetical protein
VRGVLDGVDLERYNDGRERWRRHRNEPLCVVGEQRHRRGGPPPFGVPFGFEPIILLLLLLPWCFGDCSNVGVILEAMLFNGGASCREKLFFFL